MSSTDDLTMTDGTDRNAPDVQVFRVYIEATAQQVWDAITSKEFSTKYGYGGEVFRGALRIGIRRIGNAVVAHAHVVEVGRHAGRPWRFTWSPRRTRFRIFTYRGRGYGGSGDSCGPGL